MRIVHVITRWRRGGAEANVLCSIEHERAAGHDVILVVGAASEPELFPSSVPVIRVDSLVREISPRTDLRGLVDLHRLLRTLSPDVVHTHESKAGVLGRLAATAVPCRVHTVHMASFGRDFGGLKASAYRLVERICGQRTHLIASVGIELGELLRRAHIAPRAEHFLVRSPIRVDDFIAVRDLPAAERAAVRSELGVDGTGPVVVVAGALEARKRPDLALDALAPLLRRQRSARLVYAGSGPVEPELRARVSELGVADQVLLLGHRADLPRVFAACDVLLHVSTAEGLPQVAVQALAAGLPVVTSGVEGMRELGGFGPVLVVEPTPEQLAHAIEAVQRDRPSPCAVTALEPWSMEALHAQRDLLLERAAAIAGKPARVALLPAVPVSVVIPTRGRPDLLPDAITSALDQTLAPLEVLVVHDDGEVPDESDPRVRHLRGDGRGAAAARNLGLAEARGELVAFLDDDDAWHPAFLERSTDVLRRSAAGFVVGWLEVVGRGSHAPGPAMPERLGPSEVVAVNPGFTGSNVVYRKDVLCSVGGFDPELAVSNDKDLLVRLLADGVPYRVLPERLVRRRVGHAERLGRRQAGRSEALDRYRSKHQRSLTRRQDRYLRGRAARGARRDRRGLARATATARMVALLGPGGVRQLRRDDAHADPDRASRGRSPWVTTEPAAPAAPSRTVAERS